MLRRGRKGPRQGADRLRPALTTTTPPDAAADGVPHSRRSLDVQRRAGALRAFDEALARLDGLGAPDQCEHSLVLIDIDDFKSVNDTYGHLVGDDVLRAVARTLRTCARRADLLVRLGGDEFVVLAAGATNVEAAALAARIHEAIGSTDWGAIARGLHVRTSIGFAATGAGTLVTDLVGSADAAMYADKRRHRVVRSPGS